MAVEIDSSPTKITYLPSGRTQITLRRCRLIVQRNGKIEEHTFDRDAITVGATEDNDLAIGDETVSRQHCRIFMEGGGFMIRDLDSTNGSYVNERRVTAKHDLVDNDLVTFGKTNFKFKSIV